jgi:3-methyladenine DNA glycosylase/8-oxoguanine DNA glycosylase
MPELLLPCPSPFRFRDVVLSHGWLHLAPFEWSDETGTLSRMERLPSGQLVRLWLTETEDGLRIATDAPVSAHPEVVRRVRWMLALDEDFSGFHQLCAGEPGLRHAAERGMGRILRCPTVWEDLVKTLFSVNTTWRQTVAMTQHLVNRYGERRDDLPPAFPEPMAVAAADPAEVQQTCRVGYRAEPLVLLARALAEGRLDLETLKDPALPTEEVEARLRSLRGIGPYAAANVLMLLGRYDHLPVDSWFRQTVRDGWFESRAVPERELVAAFDRFRPYRTLVYRFFDWERQQSSP